MKLFMTAYSVALFNCTFRLSARCLPLDLTVVLTVLIALVSALSSASACVSAMSSKVGAKTSGIKTSTECDKDECPIMHNYIEITKGTECRIMSSPCSKRELDIVIIRSLLLFC
jgi:hypothetical protein